MQTHRGRSLARSAWLGSAWLRRIPWPRAGMNAPPFVFRRPIVTVGDARARHPRANEPPIHRAASNRHCKNRPGRYRAFTVRTAARRVATTHSPREENPRDELVRCVANIVNVRQDVIRKEASFLFLSSLSQMVCHYIRKFHQYVIHIRFVTPFTHHNSI